MTKKRGGVGEFSEWNGPEGLEFNENNDQCLYLFQSDHPYSKPWSKAPTPKKVGKICTH